MSVTRASNSRFRLTLFFALASAAVAGCQFGPPAASAVAQGRYFSTGNPNYDEFFVRLHRMQVELGAAPETLAQVRANLARELELAPPSAPEALRAALSTKADAVGARGATLQVVPGRDTGKGPRLAVSGSPAAADQPFVKTLGEAIERLAEIRERSPSWERELEWLPPAGIALDGSVEAAFIGQSRGTRDDVHENLADAQKVVALMRTRKLEIDASSAELEELFVSALGEKRSEPAPPAAEDPPTKPKARTAPRPRAAGDSPQAGSRPAAPAAEGSEPAPAPKPKQGSARPDFEP
jgi:hypothetical protein